MLAIVQARQSSARLPGKTLMSIAGRALLGRVIDRLEQALALTKIVVATSTDRSDEPIVDFCAKESIACYRGPLADVAERFRGAAEQEAADSFVRISGDSPLIDPSLVDTAVAHYEAGRCDLVTNVFVRTFPRGQSVEVVRTEALEVLRAHMRDDDREHVTRAFYRNAHAFRIVSFTSGVNAGAVNLCIDTADDVSRVERLVGAAPNGAGWRELLAIYDSLGYGHATTPT
jgi:spore coat polysaccharide biosynthesis protein SpsF (cytidylyltransferase family)